MNFSEKTDCLNCGSPLTTDFCGDCGQQKAQRISFSLLLKIMQRGIIEFKSPLIVTFTGLFINPGKVYREYLDGRRATYFNPIRYAFWLLTLSIFVAAYLDVPIYDLGMFSTRDEKNGLPTNALEIMTLVESSIIYVTFFLALICAVCLKLFFRRNKYTISELYIPCLLNISQPILIALILILLGYYKTIYGQIFYASFSSIYFVWAISHLFQQRTWWTYVKVIFSGMLSFIIFSCMFAVTIAVTFGVNEGFNEAYDAKIQSELNKKTVNESAQ